MSKFATLLKLEFVNNSSHRDERLFSRLFKAFFSFIGFGAILGLILYAVIRIMNVFLQAAIGDEFILYFSALISIMQVVIGLGMTIKTLYQKTSINILKLPVDGKLILFSKITYLYIKEFTFTTGISLPVYIIFGIKTGAGALFYGMLAPNLLLLSLIPFFVSILLSVPVIYLMRALKNRYIILLILYAAIMSLAFVGYIYALKFILDVLNNSNISNIFSDATIYGIKQFANYLLPFVIFKNCLLGYKLYQSLTISIATIILLGFFIYIFAEKFYFKIILKLSENQQKNLKKCKVKDRSVTKSLMRREFINIFRSSNYAFQYLTIIVTTPLMVYFSSQIASYVSTGIVGNDILPGITVLVIIMFLSIGTSFSASTITREGDTFYHTKIIPVSFTKQVRAKLAIYLIVSIPAVFISCLFLALAGFISYVGALLTAISISMIIFGNTCASISIDIRRPQFKYLENGEITTSNININASITVGFIVALIMGTACIVISYFVNIPAMYLVLYGFGIPYSVIESAMLFARLEKRYNAVEV